ncbi:AsnC family transcriptional regulator [Enteractinococcus helveticum]|uniref:AsnC family transcriptional regulator n=2 Tax=Enteractinococcus helveticum TaxID=1837282 RepID=A0A1B7M1N5_9MICC|nr:AsnC family transcriptional regulator [Enteractinococcus helveticum]
MPYAELARQTRVTEKTVRRRVTSLLESNFMQISAVTDPSLLGFEELALVLISLDGTKNPAQIAEAVAVLPEVDYVTVTTGTFPLQAEIVCIDRQELYTVAFDKIGALIGVQSVEVLSYLRLHYQQARFFPAQSKITELGVRPMQIDDLDRKIISQMADNGRTSFSDIAATLQIPIATVRLRYGKLSESGAVKVMCIINPLRLGYTATSWVGLKIGPGTKSTEVAEALTNLNEVSYVAITSGRFHVLAEVIASTREDLIRILDERIRAIPGVQVSDTWTYIDLYYKALKPRKLPRS